MDQNLQQVKLEQQRQLLTLLKEQKRRRGMNDLWFLSKHILGYNDLTDQNGFHGDFCRHLEGPKKFKLSLTPRGSLKSSIGTIAGSVKDIINDPNTRGLIASEKFTISTKFLSEIKGHLENNLEFIDLYGNLKSEKKWTESEIIVSTRTSWKKEPTISCAGIDVTKVGMHYDWIRVDDPHSDQNTTNQDQIDKVIRWYRLLLSLLDPGGRMYINGTIWHYNDLYNHIEVKERERVEAGRKRRFAIFKKDSFQGTTEELLQDRIPDSKLLWPERLSAEFLRDQYLEQGPYIFSCQYRLNPVDDESATFKKSWLKFCTHDEVPDNLSYFTVVDPMVSEKGDDYLSIVTVGMSEQWQCYILDVRRRKADEHDTVDEMIDVYNNYRPQRIGFETVAFQQSYMKYIQLLQMMRGVRMPVTQLKTSTRVTKPMRIKGMVPYFKAGLYTIPTRDGTIKSLTGHTATLVDELLRFPKAANDDCIDALAYINQLTARPSALQILRKINPNSFMAIRARNKKPRNVLGRFNVRKSTYAN